MVVSTRQVLADSVALDSHDVGGDVLSRKMLSAAANLVRFARRAAWRGADSHDGLYWRWPRGMVATPLRRQIIIQLHLRSPLDIRFVHRGPRPRLAKTLALFTKAGILAGSSLDDPALLEAARASGSELVADRAAGPEAWGYPFPVQTRWSSYPADSPNVVVTAFAIDALLLAADHLEDESFRSRATKAAAWVADRLLTADGHFAYHEHADVLIHNANLLGAAAVYKALGQQDLVGRAIERTLDAQQQDGSWPYGAAPNLTFVDSFHTAYVLGSLITLRDVDPSVDSAIWRGAAYWTERFFDKQGRAMMWPDRRFPEDGHSAGTALSTLALLSRYDATFVPVLRAVARRSLDAMLVGGRTVHQRRRVGRTRVQYLRWCDGHMAIGLAGAGERLSSSRERD